MTLRDEVVKLLPKGPGCGTRCKSCNDVARNIIKLVRKHTKSKRAR